MNELITKSMHTANSMYCDRSQQWDSPRRRVRRCPGSTTGIGSTRRISGRRIKEKRANFRETRWFLSHIEEVLSHDSLMCLSVQCLMCFNGFRQGSNVKAKVQTESECNNTQITQERGSEGAAGGGRNSGGVRTVAGLAAFVLSWHQSILPPPP